MARRRVLMDLRPLRESPAFRRLWLGWGLSSFGSQMTSFAVALQVYEITRSSLAVGAVGLSMALPTILLALVGGAVADAVDRRELVLITSACLTVVSAVFAAQAFAGMRQVWLLYGLVAVQSLLNAVNAPARGTFLSRLLPPHLVPAGAALNAFTFHASMTAGTALAGVITAVWGLKICYLVDALSFAAALHGVARLPAMPPEAGTARPGLRSVVDGLRFIRRTAVVKGAFLADMSAMALGAPMALLPAINAEHFGGGPETLGLLTAAPTVGGLLGSALSGPVGRVRRQGRAMLVAGAVWGAGLVGFGLATHLGTALALLAIAGAADSVSVVFRTAMAQSATPDSHRGRVSAAEYVVGAGCPYLGNFRAGLVGSLVSPAFGVISGGVATIAGAALIGLLLPAFTRYTTEASDQEPARPPAPQS
ncbi:MFS transporter [Streptoalloteichus hindustanus]|uniref:Predicted arabinose efflux permease, MFS family n=1 Tax=Streptoalloteichus hindustanus TaxID=2017 RepID=A0A1M5I567_STRHI|nr:MFS transporter [Streptoalloteichus hindustanus]SHG23476.1 Predicted arabinose efflux permease, MFS family [Streptoalloteichus hindustanus]